MKTVTIHDIDPTQLQAFLLDIRTPAEFNAIHVPGSTSHPLETLDVQAVREFSSNRPCYVLCQSGARAEVAVRKLQDAGIDAVLVEGGLQAWLKAGKPVNRGPRRVLPLIRQVLTAAGILTLAGCLLGFFVHPAWFSLSAFVGFGLTVAGLTGFCPMAFLLAKMPWNFAPRKTCCGSC